MPRYARCVLCMTVFPPKYASCHRDWEPGRDRTPQLPLCPESQPSARWCVCIACEGKDTETNMFPFVRVSSIANTQSTVRNGFTGFPYSVDEHIDFIRMGYFKPTDYPAIRVARDEWGDWHSIDNRRTFILRSACFDDLVRVIVVPWSKEFACKQNQSPRKGDIETCSSQARWKQTLHLRAAQQCVQQSHEAELSMLRAATIRTQSELSNTIASNRRLESEIGVVRSALKTSHCNVIALSNRCGRLNDNLTAHLATQHVRHTSLAFRMNEYLWLTPNSTVRKEWESTEAGTKLSFKLKTVVVDWISNIKSLCEPRFSRL